MLTLRYADIKDRVELEKVCFDPWAEQWGLVHYWESILNKNIEKMIEFIPGMAQGIGIPADHVPCSFFFAFNQHNEIVGRTSIRHELTPFLTKEGGHIGYGVMPQHRQKGHATEILKLSLEYCKYKLNLERVLVTCDDENIASWKTIEKNNGILENKILRSDGVTWCRRYWIELK